MAYGKDFRQAAHRYLRAGQSLFADGTPGARPGSQAVAGYLFGLAGELAVKQLMRKSGMKPLPEDQRRDDPFYSHFPSLKSMLNANAHGRRAGVLRAIAENSSLFQFWDTDMRYAPTSDIPIDRVSAWKESAEELVGRMED